MERKMELTQLDLDELRRILNYFWNDSLCGGDWKSWNKKTRGDYKQEDFENDVLSFKRVRKKVLGDND